MAMDAFSASLMKDKREIVIAPTIYKFDTFGAFAEEFKLGERDVVLTNEFIYKPFMEELGLKSKFVFQEKFGAGEPSEEMIQVMYDAIPYDSYDRVIAVGGGLVGDLAGFAASIYMRGIDFINCPTTTLSMIDSSIGGKTAVDLGDTKNIVGAFWQPKLVIVDPATLSTLPRRHYINGLAEAVKAGLLADPELFAIFEKGDIDTQISEIIYRSLRFKKNVVEQDETERGMRKALNFGHTIGHGIEAVKGIKGRRTVGLFHGECVALGMLPMIESKALQKRVRAVYRRIGLPTRTTYNKEKVLAEMLHDKKAQGGQITVIKVPGLGCWRAETIPVEGLRPLLGVEE